jgi:hypothetical protein
MLFSVLLNSCKPQHSFPKEPYLEFVSLNMIDNGTSVDEYAELILYFTDGDGNIGLDNTFNYPPFDTNSVYFHNFFVTYYAKRNGEFVAFPEFEFNTRLPRFLSSNNPTPLEGEIKRILYIRNPLATAPDVDTVKFECQIVDRDLNESNRIFTSEIIVRNR